MPTTITTDQIHIPYDMKIIGYIEEEFSCCTEKVILEYAPHLMNQKYASIIIPSDKHKDILTFVADYMVLFRTGFQAKNQNTVKAIGEFRSYVQKMCIPSIYYADDLIFVSSGGAPLFLASLCDKVIVATESLKTFLQEPLKDKDVIVLPTHVDLINFDMQNKITWPDDKFRILLTSSGRIGASTLYDIVSTMNESPEKYKGVEIVASSHGVAQLRGIINKFRNVNKRYFDWMQLKEFYGLCKSVDLIIAPAERRDLEYFVPKHIQQLWLDCKSEVKYTLAGAAKIPIIASPTASYRDSIKHEKTGFLALSSEEFIKYIDMLIGSKELRKDIGHAAREHIEAEYDVRKRVDSFIDILKSTKDIQLVQIKSKDTQYLFIPAISGGPRSFMEMMSKNLPTVSGNKWSVTTDLELADAAIIIAYVCVDEILNKKEQNKNLKTIARVDGLPMTFDGVLEPFQLEDMKKAISKADVVVWQSNDCKNYWKEHVDVSKGIVIHNGVDLEIFNQNGEKHPFDESKFNILNVNWSTFKHKRVDLLKEIIQYATKDDRIHFTLVGQYIDTSVVSDMELWTKYPNVTYVGPIRDYSTDARKRLASMYRGANALLFLSEMEGSPNTILEAIACGLPIISNKNSKTVAEICGGRELEISNEGDFFKHVDLLTKDSMFVGWLKKEFVKLAEQFSAEECVRKYLEVING